MFLKAKDMQALFALAKSMKMETIGEAMGLLKTLREIRAHWVRDVSL